MAWASKNRKKLNKISKAEKAFADMLKEIGVFAHRNWGFQTKGGKYRFVDFMLRKRKVIVEIDGPEHKEDTDKAREEEILQVFKKYKFLRFANDEVLFNIGSVKRELQEVLNKQ